MKPKSNLLKNVGLLTIGNFSSKVLVFLLTPLYTNVLSTSEYGTFDFILTTTNLLIPIVTVDIVDATLRFSMEENCSKKGVISVSLFFYFIGGVFVSIFLNVISFLGIVQNIPKYGIFLMLLYAVNALSGILTSASRGFGKVKESAVSGIIATFVTVICNLLFLLPLHLGMIGYFGATVLGTLAQCIYLGINLKVFRYIEYDRDFVILAKEMTGFSKPLILNNIAWWINNASDRYVVTYYCGISNNGIYSVSYKIPTVLNVLQSIFQQAWILSAVQDYNKEDKGGFFSYTYSMYNFFLVILCSILIFSDRALARLLYAKEFFTAWEHVPFLCLGFVFVALANYMGGIFQAVMNPEIIAYSTVGGAAINILLDFILTPRLGPGGAAIATCISYYVVWQIRLLTIKKHINLEFHLIKDYLSYFLIVIQIIECIFVTGVKSYLFQLITILLIIILNFDEMRRLYGLVARKLEDKWH